MRMNIKGITLIALVITIIVLLILAGVSIAMLTGQNGILSQAEKTKIETRAGQVQEEVSLWKTEKQMGEYGPENIKTETELLESFKERELVYPEEIDEANKIIKIGSKEISYAIENFDLDTDVSLEDDAGREALIIETTPLGPLTEEDMLGKYYSILPILPYKFSYDKDGIPDTSNEILVEVDCNIDWGDGNIEHITTESINNDERALMHFYDEPGTYEVKVTGTCPSIVCSEISAAFNIKIKQWGTVGIESIAAIGLPEIPAPTKSSFKNLEFVLFDDLKSSTLPEYLFANCYNMKNFSYTFSNCTNLQEIPDNIFTNCINAENFIFTFGESNNINKIGEDLFEQCYNAKNFIGTFGNSKITEIPEGLFRNNKKAENFESTFHGTPITDIPTNLFKNNTQVKSFIRTFLFCSKLKNIPENLFDNCSIVESFLGTFNGCEKVEGNVPELWTRGDNTQENNYQGEHPYGHGCYGGCTKVSGYLNNIPEFWRSSTYSS